MRTITVGRDYEQWRRQAREVLAAELPPEAIIWQEAADDQLMLFGAGEPQQPKSGNPKSRIRVPAEYADLAHDVFHHRSSERLALLYRLLWRLTHGERELLNIEVDDDVRQAVVMQRQVGWDAHRMSGFVRFEKASDEQGDVYLAWYRPDHYVVPMTAGSFVRRFGDMRWSILTPDLSAHWDLKALRFGAGAPNRPRASDQLVSLYQTYYVSTNNPLRDNPRLFRQHVPTRFLHDMPEGEASAEIKSRRGRR